MKPFTVTQKYCYDLIQASYPDDTSFTASDLSTKGQKVAGRTLSSLMDRGYIIRINNKSPYIYVNAHKKYIEEVHKSIEANGYTKHTRDNNQYFAEYIEKAVCAIINKKEIINDTGYPFTEKDMQLMNRHAQNWVEAEFSYAYHADYLGRKTITEDCDIIINYTDHVELKYIAEGNGTYLNTSIYYFTQFGFDFHDYMENMGYLDFLTTVLGSKIVKRNNKSPVSQEVSSNIRKNNPELYKTDIVPADKKVRQTFVNDLINYFTNPEYYDDLQLFGYQMLIKETATSQKRNPDFISVYGYSDDITRRIYPNQILKPNEPIIITQEQTFNKNKEAIFSIKLNNVIRVQIGWQNGTGLNNPTIRVFIEKK